VKKEKKLLVVGVIVTLAMTITSYLPAQVLSIYDIQYTTDPAGNSPQAGNTVNCSGGIVIHKYGGTNPKLTLYDPTYSTGWGGLATKDFTGTDAFAGINVGDWVSFDNILVEEYRGNTQLSFDTGATFSVESTGHTLPDALVVSPDDIAAPVEGPPSEWYVSDHSAEIYEGMYVQVEDVTVTAMGLGKAGDNYALENIFGDSCWGSDYMNLDAGGPYHPLIYAGSHLESVSGILEQYTKLESGWDYYQMLTTSNLDIVPEPTSMLLLLAGSSFLLRRKKDVTG